MRKCNFGSSVIVHAPSGNVPRTHVAVKPILTILPYKNDLLPIFN